MRKVNFRSVSLIALALTATFLFAGVAPPDTTTFQGVVASEEPAVIGFDFTTAASCSNSYCNSWCLANYHCGGECNPITGGCICFF